MVRRLPRRVCCGHGCRGGFVVAIVDLKEIGAKMNHYGVKQNAFAACEEMRVPFAFVDQKAPIFCPRPRRFSPLAAVTDPLRPLLILLLWRRRQPRFGLLAVCLRRGRVGASSTWICSCLGAMGKRIHGGDVSSFLLAFLWLQLGLTTALTKSAWRTLSGTLSFSFRLFLSSWFLGKKGRSSPSGFLVGLDFRWRRFGESFVSFRFVFIHVCIVPRK
ncbi:hypothetical protein BHM03_00030150 [Ensete ventricosum]|nr:hypothetical protein BHM03_00030150 [Ensete ventricosum]